MVRNVVTGLLLLVLAAPVAGCGPAPPDEFSFRADRGRIAGLRLWDDGPRGPRLVAEVTDPAVVAFFVRQLDAAQPAAPPDPPPNKHYLSFRVGPGKTTGETRRYPYLCNAWDPEGSGYVELDGRWVQVPPAFNGLLFSLADYRHASGAVDGADAAFLKRYGWTPLFRINSGTVKLPDWFVHRAGEFPVVLYWAYNNELNSDIGLDLAPYLGREVEVTLYKVVEPLPAFMDPRRWAGRAVVVKVEGRIVGTWLDAGRHYGFACSLKGRRLEEITGRAFAQWVAGVIDYDDAAERRLAALAPEEVIRTYYEAINRRDYRLAHACETRERLTGYLFMNMDNNWVYNASYESGSMDGLENIRQARVLAVRELKDEPGAPDTRRYAVEVDLRFKKVITMDNGRRVLFFTLKKETERTGWRIAEIGTGP